MKKTNTFMLIGAFLLAFSIDSFSQQVLPEVTVRAFRYKYLTAVSRNEVSQPVRMLQRRAAEYTIKNADFYEEEYDTYFVSFYIPDGEILAAYDKEGKLLSTVEKYKNIQLPKAITTIVTTRFPQWAISKDVYQVNFEGKDGSRKVYKLTLENGDRRLKVKLNEKGEFI